MTTAAETTQEIRTKEDTVKPESAGGVALPAKTSQEISTEEKLIVREIENEYLKAQMEIQRLSQITQAAQKKFTTTVETMTKKYAIDPATFIFDNVALVFKKI